MFSYETLLESMNFVYVEAEPFVTSEKTENHKRVAFKKLRPNE
jgi:hypothetical protein